MSLHVCNFSCSGQFASGSIIHQTEIINLEPPRHEMLCSFALEIIHQQLHSQTEAEPTRVTKNKTRQKALEMQDSSSALFSQRTRKYFVGQGYLNFLAHHP